MKQSNLKEYFRPQSLAEACKILLEYKENIMPIAGGTDIFTANHLEISALLDVDSLGLAYIKETNGEIIIGASTSFADIIESPVIKNHFTALWEAAKVLADMTTRNMATIGGNICTALPSGDSISPLFAANASLVLVSASGERSVEAKDFFRGPRQTVLVNGELLKEIVVKKTACGSAFEKMGRNSEDLAIANVAAYLQLSPDGAIADIRIAHGAVAPTVVYAESLQKELIGKKPDAALLDKLAHLVEEAISPIDNVRATAAYRRECSKALMKRAVRRAYEYARGGLQ